MSSENASRYERTDISARAVFAFFLSLAVSLLLIGGSIAAFTTVLSHHAISRRTVDPATKPSFPSPELQTRPTADMAAFLDGQKRDLESYGWVDRRAGVIHIPIERAIDLILERGLPARDGNAGGEP